jgi:hypothetical protein
MNVLMYETAHQAIETLEQVEAILDSFPTLSLEVDSATAFRVLSAAQSLATMEIKRQHEAAHKALRSEAAREKGEA